MNSNEPNRCEPNQSTYRQCLPKVCVQQFGSQYEGRFRIFWALLVHFGFGIMCQKRNLSILNFLVSEVKKLKFGSVEKMGVNVEIETFKMDMLGNSFSYMDIVVKQCLKVPYG